MSIQKFVCKEDSAEVKNIIHRLNEPRMITSIIVLLYSTIMRRALRLFKLNKFLYYPKNIINSVQSLKKSTLNIKVAKPKKIKSGPYRLKLATDYCYFKDFPNWEYKYKEHEQFVSIHRWNWLLFAASTEVEKPCFSWGESLVRSWIIDMSPLPQGEASETYTVSERISNYCLFVRCTLKDWNKSPKDIAEALVYMAYSVVERIEYFPNDLTGNHVVNNARALIFAGHCFNEPDLVIIGRELLKERLPILIVDGFLREGSSHYQFLFTRWIIELTLLSSEKKDEQTLNLLEPYLNPLIRGCNFFLVKGKGRRALLPTFGDISPDCDPSWLIDLTNSALITNSNENYRKLNGWAKLFPELEVLDVFNRLNISGENGIWRVHSKSGWYRLDVYGWTAIWHIDPFMDSTIATHAHRDSGSFVLFRDGKEVLIDPGRMSYDSDKPSLYGFHGMAHNNILIDKCTPFLSSRDRLYPEYHRRAIFNTSRFIENNSTYVFSYTHDGFSRLKNGISDCRRDFKFSKDSMVINDFFYGSGRHDIECRFHLPYEDSCVDIECIEEANSERCEVINLTMSDNPMGGWKFPSYGLKKPSLTRCFVGSFSFPTKCSYILKLTK